MIRGASKLFVVDTLKNLPATRAGQHRRPTVSIILSPWPAPKRYHLSDGVRDSITTAVTQYSSRRPIAVEYFWSNPAEMLCLVKNKHVRKISLKFINF